MLHNSHFIAGVRIPSVAKKELDRLAENHIEITCGPRASKKAPNNQGQKLAQIEQAIEYLSELREQIILSNNWEKKLTKEEVNQELMDIVFSQLKSRFKRSEKITEEDFNAYVYVNFSDGTDGFKQYSVSLNDFIQSLKSEKPQEQDFINWLESL